MSETYWTLPMTVAWIAWRNIRDVLDSYDPYRVQRLDWHYRVWRLGPDGPIYKGCFLKERQAATLSLLALTECYDVATGSVREGSIGVSDAIARLAAFPQTCSIALFRFRRSCCGLLEFDGRFKDPAEAMIINSAEMTS